MKIKGGIHYIALLALVSCTHYGGMSNDGGGSGGFRPGNDRNYTDTKLLPSEYVKWAEDENNGLKNEKTIDDMVYTAQYKPYNYIICEEQKNNSIPDSVVKNAVKQLGGMQYIDLKIALKSGQGELLKYKLGSAAEYDYRVNYFAFGMQKDIQLIQGGDTLACVLYHFERAYDVAPFGTFLLGFPAGKNPNADRTLQFTDHFFNKGIIKLFFEAKNLKNIPALQTI